MIDEDLKDCVLTHSILFRRDIYGITVGGHATVWSTSSDLDHTSDPAKNPSADKTR